jgi:hypothetical protein
MKPSCYNRPPFKEYVKVQDGWLEDGRANFVYIADPMTKRCVLNDPPFGEALLRQWDCEGCKWCALHRYRIARIV